ncbi:MULTISPECIES: hypothetical protein [Pseudomonas]|jgi:hypothetical protein|uniref:hypothetical protein n=1 Tax=Pseudomonas TaxID=286 RepID=UPI0009AD5630|nr:MULTISPECIES: hypothetical protein [Pseudomonas]MBK3445986.1 hypothetical protein [Pseudomonas lactis]MDU8418443.1 hypothetical protein [Pseudomonas syringae]QXW42675.1 hypothetical protein KXJ79_12990 [Pseudomonas amygdali]
MTKKTSGSQQSSSQRTQANHRSDTLNVNKGTSGSNITNSRVHGNRGKQLNPNQQ